MGTTSQPSQLCRKVATLSSPRKLAPIIKDKHQGKDCTLSPAIERGSWFYGFQLFAQALCEAFIGCHDTGFWTGKHMGQWL